MKLEVENWKLDIGSWTLNIGLLTDGTLPAWKAVGREYQHSLLQIGHWESKHTSSNAVELELAIDIGLFGLLDGWSIDRHDELRWRWVSLKKSRERKSGQLVVAK